MRAAYREHPWLVDIPISGAPITPNSLLIVDWFLREVRSLPLSDGEKMSTLLLLTSYARATERPGTGPRRRRSRGGRSCGRHRRELLRGARRARDPRAVPRPSPLLAAGGYVAEPGTTPEETDDDFSFGLERILDGIEYHVGRVESGAAVAPPGRVAAGARAAARQAGARGREGTTGGGEGAARGAEARTRGDQHASGTRSNARGTRARRRSGRRSSAGGAGDRRGRSAHGRGRPIARREVAVVRDRPPAVGGEDVARSPADCSSPCSITSAPPGAQQAQRRSESTRRTTSSPSAPP